MPVRPRLLAFLAAGLSLPLHAQPATSQFETVHEHQPADSESQTDEVQFASDGYERMTVDVTLGGTGPYRFLVDTGADRTAVSREVAARLGLPATAKAKLHSVSGETRVAVATLPVLQLSRKEVREIEAPLLERAHMGADGILGVDSLRAQRVLFDFKAQTLSIVAASSSAPEERDDGAIIVRGRLKNGRLVLTNATAERQRVDVVLDTGSQYSVGNHALMRRLLARGQLKILGQIELTSVTGAKIRGDYAVLDRLEMGGATLRGLVMVFTDSHVFRQLKLHKRPALLMGMNALRGFDKVSIDFAARKLRVVLPEGTAREWPSIALR